MNLSRKLSLFLILNLIFIVLIGIMYFNFSSDFESFSNQSLNDLNSIENIIVLIHKENTQMYRVLLTEDLTEFDRVSLEYTPSNISNIFKDLILVNVDKKDNINLDSNIDNIFMISSLRAEILNLHESNLISSQENYNQRLNSLLIDYEFQVKNTIELLKTDINKLKEENQRVVDSLNFKILIGYILLFLFYILSLIFILFGFKLSKLSISDKKKDKKELVNNEFKEDLILDSDSNKILEYLKVQIKKGYFPTIKDIKLELDLTHPTILNRLKVLEEKGFIFIQKKGRNKHIVLK